MNSRLALALLAAIAVARVELAAAGSAAGGPTLADDATAPSLVLHAATVIDGTGSPARPGLDVVIAGDRIAAVGQGCDHPPGARVIDASRLFVLPGLIDMHAHLLEHGRDAEGNIPPRVDWEAVRRNLRLLLAHGVTTVRDPGSETEAAVTLRRMLAEGALAGPRLLTAGRILNASPFDPEPFLPVRTAEEIRREIRWQHAAGVDFIKLYSSMPPELVRVAVEEAHGLGLPVIAHLQRTPWGEAARLGVDQIAHGASWSPDLLPAAARGAHDGSLFGRVRWLEQLDLDGPELRATLDELARHQVVVDPTLIAYHTKFFGNAPRWLESTDNALLPRSWVEGWRAGSFTRDWTAEQYAAAQLAWPRMLALTRRMFERGIRLVVGTDTPGPWIVPGASFHQELALLRDAGIPEAALIRLATAEGARALGLAGEAGEVRPGLRADLLVLAADPLARIENTREIVAVVQGGRVVHEAPPLSPEEAQWNQPVAPFRIAGNLYYVGAREVASYLIATAEGHVLIDSGFEQTVPQVLANVEALGFRAGEVRLLLASHAHADHVGGMATLRERTGARLLMSAADAELAARGGQGDPNFGDRFRYRPFTPDARLRDGEVVELGGSSLTAHLTPGHTPGCTTWSMTVEERGAPLRVVFLCSVTAPTYRLVDNAGYPRIADDYRFTFDRLAGMTADIFLGPHGSFFGLLEKRAVLCRNPERNPFVDREALSAHVAARRAAFERQLAEQRRGG
jgi:imidazolonepropionase-like amidohydrolase/glyoxylase-like metal-dependent hydrolase (beta-lactamase superfamily II)